MKRAISLAAVALLSGCSLSDVDLRGKRCPCAAGWVCDDRNVCIPTAPTRIDAGEDARAGMSDARVPADVPDPSDATAVDARRPDAFSGSDAGTFGPFGPGTLVPGIDSADNEDDPSMTADGLEIYFDSNRLGASAPDIFVATRPDTASDFGAPVAVAALNTAGIETGPFVSPDGLALYFSGRGDPRDLWVSTRASRGGAWGTATRIDELSSAADESGPSVTADGLTFFFLSTPSGERKIYVSTRSSTADPWGTPALVSEVDGAEEEDEPSISPDGLTLVFSRVGSSLDLYITGRPDLASPFDPPMPIAELNTAFGEFDPWLSGDGRTLLYGSNASGDQAIWIATR